MKNKGVIIRIFVIALLAIGFWWWKGRESKTQEKDVVKIGVILPLTGEAAFVGEPVREGIQTRLSEFNSSNENYEIVLIYEDTKANPTTAKNALMKLKQQNIDLVIGPASSGEASVLIPDANKYRITLLSPTASKQSLAISNDFFFRNELSDGIGARLQAKIALDTFNWKDFSVIYVNNEYGNGVKTEFEDEIQKNGGAIVNSMGFDKNQTDFSTIVNKIKNDTSDVIFIIAENQYVNIIKNLKEQGVQKTIYATPVFENQDNLNQLGKSAEGVIYSYYGNFDIDSDNQRQKDFIAMYKEIYSKEPSYYAALGYESMDLVIKALEKNNFKTSNINFMEIQNYESVTGTLSFNENGDVVKPISIKTVKNGKFVFK